MALTHSQSTYIRFSGIARSTAIVSRRYHGQQSPGIYMYVVIRCSLCGCRRRKRPTLQWVPKLLARILLPLEVLYGDQLSIHRGDVGGWGQGSSKFFLFAYLLPTKEIGVARKLFEVFFTSEMSLSTAATQRRNLRPRE